MPPRIRLQRTKGWRSPEGGVVNRAEAVARFERDLMAARLACAVDDVRRELAGRDLACWCPEDEPCHADVLLRVANDPGP
jgi:hypothetical protein